MKLTEAPVLPPLPPRNTPNSGTRSGNGASSSPS